ncbi:MAG: PEGA domain-containing protein [Acidobacteriota bacterium]
MNLKYIAGPVALVGLLGAAVPAQAQGRRDNGNRSDRNAGEKAQPRQAAPQSQPADRGRNGRSTASRPDRPERDRQAGGPQNRTDRDRQAGAPTQGRPDRERPNAGAPQARADRGGQPGAVARERAVPRVDTYRGNRYERPRTVIIQPRRAYRSSGYRPYTYTFRPRVRVGFGVFLGYPVAYPYYDPYAYPAQIYGSPYPYGGYPAQTPGYPPQGPGYQVGPGGAVAYGGISLDISPRDAAVYVDGTYVGVADDFYDPSHPLSVLAGRHRIEVQAPGYQPLTFDVDVLSGQVIPYQGDLQP